jgi:hypothetical protein
MAPFTWSMGGIGSARPLRMTDGTFGLDISDMTLNEASWRAAKANTQHGLPLKMREYRDVFRAFIDSHQHKPGKKLIPYREIAT